MPMSVYIASSLAVLLVGALAYLISMGTTDWTTSDGAMKYGIWDYCIFIEADKEWECQSCDTDFCMASQAFSILCILCYACAFLMYFVYIIFPSLYQSKPVTMGLCLLSFSIVSLQIMTMIVFGVKIQEFFVKMEIEYFSHYVDPMHLSWSFAFAITSTALATICGICTFIELRNITIDDLED